VKQFWKKGENQRRGETREKAEISISKVRVRLTFIDFKSIILMIAINMFRISF